ncbi:MULTISPECIES: hypothetical protein [unclassified Bradyrhizobium]|uniref:hypothetical protein n=1 Tax=unclassified Bradyrhizobium TaxID=2631580 RepID=UPI003D20B950
MSSQRRFQDPSVRSPELIAERIRVDEAIGVDMIPCAFLNFTDELPAFGREVIALLNPAKANRAHEPEPA